MAALIVITLNSAGSYYVRVRHPFNTGSPLDTYDLRIANNATPTPTNTPSPTRTPTPTPSPDPACDDAYEADNSAAQARPLLVGSTQHHAFCAVGDQDWVSFQASAGTTYHIETLNLAPDVDTVLVLYGSNGTTQLASNGDASAGPESLIEYTFDTSGTYYVKVFQNNSLSGPAERYDSADHRQSHLRQRHNRCL